jgi:hypothetical protein
MVAVHCVGDGSLAMGLKSLGASLVFGTTLFFPFCLIVGASDAKVKRA